MIARGILGDGKFELPVRPFGYKPPPYDASDPVTAILEARRKQLELEHTRVLLAEPINAILYDDICEESRRAFGTESTRSNYKSDFNKFAEWARENKLPSLPT